MAKSLKYLFCNKIYNIICNLEFDFASHCVYKYGRREREYLENLGGWVRTAAWNVHREMETSGRFQETRMRAFGWRAKERYIRIRACKGGSSRWMMALENDLRCDEPILHFSPRFSPPATLLVAPPLCQHAPSPQCETEYGDGIL